MAQLIRSLTDFPPALRGGAVAVGNFDGVHRGHAELIAELMRISKSIGGPAVVVTFDPPPVAILVPDRPPSEPLTSIRRRAELLGSLGVDALVAIPTDRALLSMTAEEFFFQIIVKQLGARGVVEGPNFHFGKDRAGDTKLLQVLCGQAGIELSIIVPKRASGAMISSTRVRELLAEGNVAAVNELLVQPHQIEGIVAKGAKRGRLLGFPTANLEALSCFIPAHGVYAGFVEIDGRRYASAVNIGPNPTFGETHSKVEIHVVGWGRDIYGERLVCTLLQRIRGIQKFASPNELKSQLESDIDKCQNLLQAYSQTSKSSDRPLDSLS